VEEAVPVEEVEAEAAEVAVEGGASGSSGS